MPVNRVRTVFTGVAGTPWYCNMYFDTDPGIEAQDMIYAAAGFWSALKGHIAAPISYEVEADVPSYNTISGALIEVQSGIAAGDAGAGGSDPLPFQVQAQITVKTGYVANNRRVQGRILVPGIMESDSVNGIGPNSSTLGASINNAVDALTINDNFVIWHRPVSGDGGFAAAPTSFSLRNKWATLRSRLD